MTVRAVFKSLPDSQEVAICSASDAVQDWVTIKADTDPSGLSVVGKVDVTQHGDVPVLGVIIEKLSDTSCIVQKRGTTGVFSGLTVGRKYWLTDSGMSVDMPKAVTGLIYTHSLGKALGSTVFEIRIDSTIYGRDDQ